MKQLQIPEAIKAPPEHRLALQLSARGVQVYRLATDDGGAFTWALVGPEAELMDNAGQAVGTHFEGPAWKHYDGSEIRGKVMARTDAPDSDAIPWLLLQVVERVGAGLFSGITYIQRVETSGGRAPEVHASREGELARIPYTATYRFFGLASE
jgi:hypothetical protein